MAKPHIQATLTVFTPNVLEAIQEKIKSEGKFTHVTDLKSSKIKVKALSLICLILEEDTGMAFLANK
jgi:hypothetical protein